MVPSEEQLLAFIGNGFRSVWAIEVLRFLTQRREHGHSPAKLISELRVSSSVIAQSVAQLEATALVVVDEAGLIHFQPASAELESLATEAVALYERRPDQVRRTIVSQTSPGITAFSDAFKLRKD
jgi:hypothetical protein